MVMPLKYLRLGFTESTLLFIYFMEIYNKHLINENIIKLKKKMIQWFYTTSGYYDKTITASYMNAEHQYDDPYIYNVYFNELLHFVKNADLFTYGIHYNKNSLEIDMWLQFLNVNTNYLGNISFFKFTHQKSILIISPFAELFKEQYISKKCEKIDAKFKEIIDIQFYINLYTFFNDGPHNNILETVDYLYNDILHTISNNYDSVVISCGAYSNILGKKFYENNKNVLTIGAELSLLFGVLNNRSTTKIDMSNIDTNVWITEIPNKYKPKDYMLIENGCYW